MTEYRYVIVSSYLRYVVDVRLTEVLLYSILLQGNCAMSHCTRMNHLPRVKHCSNGSAHHSL